MKTILTKERVDKYRKIALKLNFDKLNFFDVIKRCYKTFFCNHRYNWRKRDNICIKCGKRKSQNVL